MKKKKIKKEKEKYGTKVIKGEETRKGHTKGESVKRRGERGTGSIFFLFSFFLFCVAPVAVSEPSTKAIRSEWFSKHRKEKKKHAQKKKGQTLSSYFRPQ